MKRAEAIHEPWTRVRPVYEQILDILLQVYYDRGLTKLSTIGMDDTEHNLFPLLETQGETKVTIKSTSWIDSAGLSPSHGTQLDIFPS